MLSARDIYDLENQQLEEATGDTPQKIGGRRVSSNFSDTGGTSIFSEADVEPFPRQPAYKPKTTPKKKLAKYLKIANKDSTHMSAYSEGILDHLYEQQSDESRECELPSNITAEMYNILINWIVYISFKYKLTMDTFCLACYLIKFCLSDPKFSSLGDDRYLFGVTCLEIAEKTEEGWDEPTIRFKDYISLLSKYVKHTVYSEKDILEMERQILAVIHFHVTFSTPVPFLRIFSTILENDSKTHNLAKYLVEYSMTDYDLMCSYSPSELAAGAEFLSKYTITGDYGFWSDDLEHYSRTDKAQAQNVAWDIYKMITDRQSKNSNLTAVIRKYSVDKFENVAKIELLEPN